MGVAGSATWRLARETNSSCGDHRKMEKRQPIAIHADMVDNQGIMRMQQTCETTCKVMHSWEYKNLHTHAPTYAAVHIAHAFLGTSRQPPFRGDEVGQQGVHWPSLVFGLRTFPRIQMDN